MPSTFTTTTNKLLKKPDFNSYVDDWNTPVNADMDDIDDAFGGATLLNATSVSGTVTLSISQYRPPLIVVTGVLTASVNYQLPSGKGGTWTFYNNTTGLFSVTFSSAGGGTSVVIAQTASVIVVCDGTNVAVANTYAAGSTTAVQYNSGGVLTGTTNFVHDGTNVGIGTPSPGSKLDVKGTLRLSGSSSGYVGLAPAAAAGSTTYILPAADGASGQFLSTNGSATLSWTGIAAGVTSFSAGSTGFTPSSATSGVVALAGTLNVANGGTGQTSYTNGQLLIGNSSGNTLAKTTLTQGSGVTISNGAGTITISATGLGGTVTSVATAGSVNGITLTGGPITSTGTITLGGTLSGVSLTSQVSGTLPVANGGTGGTSQGSAQSALDVPSRGGSGASGLWTINVTGSSGSCTGNAATASNPAGGGTFITSSNIGSQSVSYATNSGTSAACSGNSATATTATNLNGGSVTATTITATGNITAYYSDDRLKTRMGYISGALAKVMSLKGFYYEANETAQALGYKAVREVGLSAQDVQAVLPEVIAPAPIDPQYLTLDYARLVPLLVEAIKEQQILINALSAKVNG
jgi:hypothetical protein